MFLLLYSFALDLVCIVVAVKCNYIRHIPKNYKNSASIHYSVPVNFSLFKSGRSMFVTLHRRKSGFVNFFIQNGFIRMEVKSIPCQ